MAINKVGSKGIEDGSVATADFAPGTVSSDKLQDNAVTNAKLTNSSVTLTGSSVSLGGSVSFNNKFVDWQSVITADGSTFNTAVSGQGYFIDTTSAAHTITLPASASRGDFIAIKDYAGTFATNNLTIARNGHNIQGVANDSLISTNRASLVLVYVDSTKGWLYWEEHNVADLQAATFITATGGTVTTSGNFKIHTFTGDGCFVVCSVGNPIGGPNSVDYLVVAGGGGSGSSACGYASGGGGAGGYRTSFPSCGCGTIAVTATTFPITVGGGGSGGSAGSPVCRGTAGSNSVFSTITSAGGAVPSGNGGSGGGGGTGWPPDRFNVHSGGSGNTPPVSPSQGNNGGSGGHASGGSASGGGGGANAVGGNGSVGGGAGGNGGNGKPNQITGSDVTYAGGGGGGNNNTNAPTGGAGGGGQGGRGPQSPACTAPQAGTANTGGGAGGSYDSPPAAGSTGGKGIVVIRYKFQ